MSGTSPGAGHDDEVVRKVLSGDRDAYREIVERYGSRLIAFCRSRMQSDEDARDAAQDVFVRAYSSLSSFRQGESFASWFFAIAANHVRTRFRLIRSEKHKSEALLIELSTAVPVDPVDEADRAMSAEALRRAVRALPPDMRWPVEFYYFAGLSVAETARVLALSEEATKTRLFRARKSLRSFLEDAQPARDSRGIPI